MDSTDKFMKLKNELQSNSGDSETFTKFTELTTLFFEVRHESFVRGLDAAKEIYRPSAES